MCILRSALTQQQVIIAIFFIDMGCFRKTSSSPRPYQSFGRPQLTALQIYRRYPDTFVSLSDKITLPIIILKNVRIYTFYIYPGRIAPRAGGIFRRAVKVSFIGHIGTDHIKQAIVVTDGRCK